MNNKFTQNMHNTLESIASKKTRFNTTLRTSSTIAGSHIFPLENEYNPSKDIVVVLHDGKHVFNTTGDESLKEQLLMEAYLFSNSAQEFIKSANDHNATNIAPSNIEVSLTDSNGASLQKEISGKVSSEKLIIIKGDHCPLFPSPWKMIGVTGHGGNILMIWENRSFLAFIAVDLEASAKTKKIKVKMIN